MKWLLCIMLAAVIVGIVGVSVYGYKLFRKMIYRCPYAKAPTPEEADEPIRLDQDWDPFREAFQEGKK